MGSFVELLESVYGTGRVQDLIDTAERRGYERALGDVDEHRAYGRRQAYEWTLIRLAVLDSDGHTLERARTDLKRSFEADPADKWTVPPPPHRVTEPPTHP